MKGIVALFDIDGTLVSFDEVENDAWWSEAFFKVFGEKTEMTAEYRTGKNEFECFRDKAIEIGLQKGKELEKKVNQCAEELIKIVKRDLAKKKVKALPGIMELLTELKKRKVILGMLTGNSTKRAKAKLSSTDLFSFFQFGAFGEEAKNRFELAELALKKAEKFGKFKTENVFVIGDSPLDDMAGKHIKAKTILAATGVSSYEKLEKENPTYLFKDFSDWKKVAEIILGERDV